MSSLCQVLPAPSISTVAFSCTEPHLVLRPLLVSVIFYQSSFECCSILPQKGMSSLTDPFFSSIDRLGPTSTPPSYTAIMQVRKHRSKNWKNGFIWQRGQNLTSCVPARVERKWNGAVEILVCRQPLTNCDWSFVLSASLDMEAVAKAKTRATVLGYQTIEFDLPTKLGWIVQLQEQL